MDIYGFCEGVIIPIENVEDEEFAEKVIGDGIAMLPSLENKFIYSPIDAKITFISKTKHCIGFTDAKGGEFFIHVGINTAKLVGEFFTVLVEKEMLVSAGDKLFEVDFSSVKSAGYNITTILVYSGDGEFEIVNSAETVNSEMVIARI